MIEPTKTLGNRYHRLNEVMHECRQFKQNLAHFSDVGGVTATLDSVNTLIQSLAAESEELGTELKARNEFFAPYATRYVKRGFALDNEIKALQKRIATQSHAIAQKRTRLLEDGVPLDAVLLAYPDYDPSQDLANIAALEAEKEAWLHFGKYSTPEYLPSSEVLARAY